MNGFYIWAMRSASMILFVVALLSIFAGLFPFLGYVKQSAHDLYGQQDSMSAIIAVQSILTGLSNAVWPFIGAVAFWRLDRCLAGKTEAAE